MRIKIFMSIIVIILGLAATIYAATGTQKDLFAIDMSYRAQIKSLGLPYIWTSADYFLVEWDHAQLQHATSARINFTIITRDVKAEDSFFIFQINDNQKVPYEFNKLILYRNGREAIVKMPASDAELWSAKGFHPIALGHTMRYFKDAPSVPYTCTYNATIADLLSKTSQDQWLDWDKKISGVEPVVIGGTTYTIATRNSSSMFNGSPNAKGFDFALQQVQSWHYGSNIEEDVYGSSWKNLILTIPGQTSPDEIVAITGHYDSTSGSPSTSAPGADDNGSGSSTLFEAARLLRQYRFQRTIKIIWFTGEEQGLLGSAAYVGDHPTSGILGVVNGDMFGYDGDNDRCFEIHAGTMTSSQDIGHCMEDSITAYSLNLPHDFIETGATTASDHASFWNVGVGAIEILENYENNTGGCVGTDFNPYYHSVNDTISHLALPFTYDIGRAAIASISAMAVPISACFTESPVLTATTDILQVDLSWTTVTGASSYRVYRSTQSCQGQWLEQIETTGTSWTDTNVTGNITYYYYVEAVASDGFCVSKMSNCATAVPPPCISCAAYQQGSAAITGISGGDSDAYPDNCETATVQVTVHNIGSSTAANTHVTITSPESFINITTPMPINVGDIPVSGNVNTSFSFGVGQGSQKATCMQIGSFNIEVQSDGQIPAAQDTFHFTFEVDEAQINKVWAFEPATGLEGWTVQQGTWALSSARVNTGGSTRSLHSSQNLDNQCDLIVSPLFTATASTQLTIPNWYAIEPQSSGYWWDRANVHIFEPSTSTRTLLNPSSGKLYQTGTFYDEGSTCSMSNEHGWAGNTTGNFWGNTVFDLSSFAGKSIQVEIRFMTDGSLSYEGVYVDDIGANAIIMQTCDAHSDNCSLPDLKPYNNLKPIVNDTGSPKANGIIDNDETVSLNSTLENTGVSTATNVTGLLTTTDPITINQANAAFPDIAVSDHKSCSTCYQLTAPLANRPATHWDFGVTEHVSSDGYGPMNFLYQYHVGESFNDVPVLGEIYVETLLHNGITGGCTSNTFCPNNYVTRDQMGKFICLSMGKNTPGSCTVSSCAGTFTDVPSTNIFCPYVEALYSSGVTNGCQASPLMYCPAAYIQRQAMAKFICNGMNTVNPGSCTLSACLGIFSDVSSGNIFCPYIEALYNAGVTSGCQASPLLYCPLDNVARSQMAKFLVLAFLAGLGL